MVAFGVTMTVTFKLLAVPFPAAFVGVTVTAPLVVPQLTVIFVVPWPSNTLAPAGTVQLYPVALFTFVM